MDCFDDYTLYSRMHFENALNVGWHIPEKASIVQNNSTVIQMLNRYLDYRVNATRGNGVIKKYIYSGKEYYLGSAEIRVLSKDGTVYAIPDSVIYLLNEGTYQLNPIVLDAVVNGYLPGSSIYEDYFRRYSSEQFWGAPESYIAYMRNAKEMVLFQSVDSICSKIDSDADLLTVVTDEGSLLHIAIKNDNEKVALFLIDKGIPLNRYNGGELFSAIDAGLTDVALRLIDKGISVQNYTPQNNPLFYAIMKKSNIVAKKLADEKRFLFCTYNTPFLRNCNILQWCVRCGNEEMLRYVSNSFRHS